MGDVLWHSATMQTGACTERQIRVSMLCGKCAQGVNAAHEKGGQALQFHSAIDSVQGWPVVKSWFSFNHNIDECTRS